MLTRLTGGQDEAVETAAIESVPLFNIAPEEVRRLDTENPDGGISLSSMDGENWLLGDLSSDFVLKNTLLQSMVEDLSSLDGRLIEEEAGNLGVYGLERPSARRTSGRP